MKKVILLLIFCSFFLLSQELDKSGEGFSAGFKIELGSVYKSLDGVKVWQTTLGMSLPLKYTFNTQWVAEINPGLTPQSAYSLTMGMKCNYFPFRNEYDKNNFFVFLGLDNAFCSKKYFDIDEEGVGIGNPPRPPYDVVEKTNSDYIFDRPIVSLSFGTGIQFRESYTFDLSISIPFNPQYATRGHIKYNFPYEPPNPPYYYITYPVKMHIWIKYGVTWFF